MSTFPVLIFSAWVIDYSESFLTYVPGVCEFQLDVIVSEQILKAPVQTKIRNVTPPD